MIENKSESMVKKYLWLIIFSVSGSLLFSLIGLHYYVDTISEYSYEMVAPHVKFQEISGNVEWVCWVNGTNWNGQTLLGGEGRNFDPHAPTVPMPKDIGYCDGYLQTKVHNWWDFLR